jgi:hypothetical protein
LQKSLIGFFLDVDQVRDLNRRLDFGKVQPLAFPNDAITIPITHDFSSSGQRRTDGAADTRPVGPGRTYFEISEFQRITRVRDLPGSPGVFTPRATT